jgi:hypothetical protein
MHAEVGNWLVVHSRRLDEPIREGLVTEVMHADGSPPYMVRWLDEDRPCMVFPSSDATVLTNRPHGAPPHSSVRTSAVE